MAEAAPCRGYLERATASEICGWAFDEANPGTRLQVVLRDGGTVIGQTVADVPRVDLRDAGIGDGAHGFAFAPPERLVAQRRHVITAEVGGVALSGEVVLPATRALLGNTDVVSRALVLGWCADPADPHATLSVQVLVDGVPVRVLQADRHRQDLAEAGIGDGRHGFQHAFHPPLSPLTRHVVELRVMPDGQLLPPPVTLGAADGFDGGLEQAIDAAIGTLGNSGTEARVLDFLLGQADRLRQIQAGAVSAQAARDLAPSAGMLRALVIDTDWPAPGRNAASQAILSHAQALADLGYAVSFIAAQALDRPAPAELATAGIEACGSPFYASVEELLRRQSRGFDLVTMHRLPNAAKYLALVRQYQPGARVLFAVGELQHLRLARQASAERRPELAAESQRARLAECAAAWGADAVLTHSPHEAELLRRLVPAATVHVVPWAVPVRPTTTAFGHRQGLAFIGDYARPANLDAARFLVEAVMPLVWAQAPLLPCLLVGDGHQEGLRALERPGIELLGHVAELHDVLDRVRLTVAPMRYGAGINGKVLTSLAAGVPVVATPVGAEGLDLPASLIATDPLALAQAILLLHRDAARHEAAAMAGLALVRARFDAAATAGALHQAIGRAA